MSKSVWIINQYTSTPKLGGGGNRSYHIADELIKQGFEVTLITSSYSHVPQRNYPVDKRFHFEKEGDLQLIVVDNIFYESGRSIKRILSMLLFWLKLYSLPFRSLTPPDYILVSSISLLPILNAFKWRSKLSNRPKVILEIRDIWPLSLIELGGYKTWNPFIMFLSWIERKAYKEADYLTSVLPAADKHIKSITKTEVLFEHISNGVHKSVIDHFDKIPQTLLDKIPQNRFIVGYSGSIGEANAMEYLIEAAKLLEDKPISFVIVGDGHRKADLVKQAKGLQNVVFHPFVAKTEVQDFLSKCDLLFVGSRNTPLYKFGVSANKIFDYMLAAKPILMTGKVPLNEIDLAGCGRIIDPDQPRLLADAIVDFMHTDINDLQNMGKRGRTFVLNYRTYTSLAESYIKIFDKLNKIYL